METGGHTRHIFYIHMFRAKLLFQSSLEGVGCDASGVCDGGGLGVCFCGFGGGAHGRIGWDLESLSAGEDSRWS